ncbi:MAG: hypothetical protein AUI36_05540 [Cyanobacteria bacterium 13_1_40CM_2_61_4]|nr:MAG: hypothetical protein AUI36_05540 [Cyanobacteria bacterium 13_1_40CM_2_61_4]
MLLMIFGVALATLMPWPMKLIVDYVLTNRPLPQSAAWIRGLPGGDSRLGLLAWLVSSTIFLYLIQRTAGIVQSYVQHGLGSRMIYALGATYFIIFNTSRYARVDDIGQAILYGE